MTLQENIFIKIFIFMLGFTVLALEIVGSRVLAPYVGATMPVWAALISVILAGSTVGYYAGGILADRMQNHTVFLWLTGAASLFIALIPTLRDVLVSLVSTASYTLGALIGSFLLFFMPAVCVSALTTYIIRLCVKNTETIGQVNGNLYGLATFGSIFGVFVTSYLLVPRFTIPVILYGLGATLLVCGVAATMSSKTES